MGLEINYGSASFSVDFNDAIQSLPNESEVNRAINSTLQDIANDLQKAISANTPKSDADEYERASDPSPQERGKDKLSESWQVQSIPRGYKVSSTDDDRAAILEFGDAGAFISKGVVEGDEGFRLELENQSGDVIYRGSVERGPITSTTGYFSEAVSTYFNSPQFRQRIKELEKKISDI